MFMSMDVGRSYKLYICACYGSLLHETINFFFIIFYIPKINIWIGNKYVFTQIGLHMHTLPIHMWNLCRKMVWVRINTRYDCNYNFDFSRFWVNRTIFQERRTVFGEHDATTMRRRVSYSKLFSWAFSFSP